MAFPLEAGVVKYIVILSDATIKVVAHLSVFKLEIFIAETYHWVSYYQLKCNYFNIFIYNI